MKTVHLLNLLKAKVEKPIPITLWFLAVKYFNKPALLELLTDSKKINSMDDEGNTLLHLAVGSDPRKHSRYENPLYKEFIELLLDEGANSSAKNNDGLTPIGIIPPGFYHFMQPHHSDIP